MFFCEQMFLTKLGNEHTCESAIYTHQNTNLIQQKCNQEYYPNLNPEPELLNAGNYLLLGNFPLPWNYYCLKIDEIPKPIHGSAYVILIGTVYRNSSSSTNNNYCLSRSSPEDPVNLKFRSAHVLHGPMRA